MEIFKRIKTCLQTTIDINFDTQFTVGRTFGLTGMWVSGTTYTTLPDWAFLDEYGFTAVVTISEPIGKFVFAFTMTDDATDETIVYFIEFEITASCDLPSYDNAICNSINTGWKETKIVWLNNIGGYENYIFTGRSQTNELNEGDAIQFKTQNLTVTNSQIKNVFQSCLVSTGEIPSSHLQKLASLKESIQAWIFDDSLPAYYDWAKRFTPIVLDRQSLVIGDTKEKVIDRTIKFIYAKEITIQGQ